MIIIIIEKVLIPLIVIAGRCKEEIIFILLRQRNRINRLNIFIVIVMLIVRLVFLVLVC